MVVFTVKYYSQNMNFRIIYTALLKFFSLKFQVDSWWGEPICAQTQNNLLHIDLFVTLSSLKKPIDYNTALSWNLLK